MPRLIIAREDEVLVASASNPEEAWTASSHLPMTMPVSLVADPQRPAHIYCGTMGSGVWRSGDAGESWEWIGEGLPVARVTAIAVSAVEDALADAVVYAGTEPSGVYRSENGGRSWAECAAFDDLPSFPEWSFPPRPETHHIRWITCDPSRQGWLYVAVEAGALLRSRDSGLSWEDRVPGGPLDTHTLAAHARAPGRIYSAAGDGYFESGDFGETWSQPDPDLSELYVWGLAVDATDPDCAVASASPGPVQAHNPDTGYSILYRRVSDGRWVRTTEGVPEPNGTVAHVLVANPLSPGVFYAVSNRGVIRSIDGGGTWKPVRIPWSEADERRRIRDVAIVP